MKRILGVVCVGVVACTPQPPERAPTRSVQSAMNGDAGDASTAAVTTRIQGAGEGLDWGEEGGRWARSRRRREPLHETDLCEVADSNLDAAARAVLAESIPTQASPRRPWNHAARPARMDLLARRFGITPAEDRKIAQNGFAVLARLEQPSYADALHEIYQSQMPLYVSIDAIFHAVYASSDALIADLERARLAALVDDVLTKMHAGLAAMARDLPAETARDIDVYLTVARSLLADKAVTSALGTDAEAAALVARARAANAMIEVQLFGRVRMVDFSQYAPRGHYAKEGSELAPYFRAAMWLSRLELNLVSRSSRSSAPGFSPDPRETPREDVMAMALAELAQRAGVMDDVTTLDRAWGLLAGKREDVTLADLMALRARAGIARLTEADAAEKLRAAIGNDYRRTARFHYMPQGSKELPAITTLLGPRVTLDSAATRPLVHAELPLRYDIGAGDIGYFLGQHRAKRYLATDFANFPELPAKLEEARAIASKPVGNDDLYSAWFSAIRDLAKPPAGVVPSFMETEAFADLRLNTTIAAYGQLRHNYVLMAGEPYEEGGCEIPDAYIEPALATYDALIAYADRGARLLPALDPKDAIKAKEYFVTLGHTLRVLRAIAAAELANEPLSPAAQRFLGMVVEMLPASTESPPSFTGWYFDLFRKREGEALEDPSFLADYYTSWNSGRVAYVGATRPRLGIFVVDTGGPPRAFIGPVARAFETHAPLTARLGDADVPKAQKDDPWAVSYTLDAAPQVPLAIHRLDQNRAGWSWVFEAHSTRALGPVTLEVLDHHGVALARASTHAVGTKPVRFSFDVPEPIYDDEQPEKEMRRPTVLHVRAGTFQAWERFPHSLEYLDVAYGGMKTAAQEAESEY